MNRSSASQLAITPLPTPAFAFENQVDRRRPPDTPSWPSELSVAIELPPSLSKSWERVFSDTQINFFFVGSPSHMAWRMSYRGLLRAFMAFASGSSVAAGARAAGIGDVAACLF